METLSLEKFNPKKAELLAIAEEYKSLTITGIDDVDGYTAVDRARKELQHKRVDIEKQGKEYRSNAIKFQKDVIALEKELIGVIEPVELELKAKTASIDLEKQKIKLMALLPDRKERLAAIKVKLDDDAILAMDIEEFETFFMEKKNEFLAEKEKAELEKERVKLIKERAKIEAEENAKKLIEDAKKKADAEKQAIIDENNRKERARIAEEERKKIEAEEKIRLEKENQEKLEKQKKYQKFLKDNNYDENTDILKSSIDGSKITLYRQVAEFIK